MLHQQALVFNHKMLWPHISVFRLISVCRPSGRGLVASNFERGRGTVPDPEGPAGRPIQIDRARGTVPVAPKTSLADHTLAHFARRSLVAVRVFWKKGRLTQAGQFSAIYLIGVQSLCIRRLWLRRRNGCCTSQPLCSITKCFGLT